jgi:hypothetical protein
MEINSDIYKQLEHIVKDGTLKPGMPLFLVTMDEEHNWKGSYAEAGTFEELVMNAPKTKEDAPRKGLKLKNAGSYGATHDNFMPNHGQTSFFFYRHNEYYITDKIGKFKKIADKMFNKKSEHYQQFIAFCQDVAKTCAASGIEEAAEKG